MLNETFRHAYIPQDWKCAVVDPKLKQSKPPGLAGSFRPISFNSSLAKVMEKMTNNRLKWHLDLLRILSSVNTRFRRGCSTTDNLIRLESSIMEGFNNSFVTSNVFLDLSKAYDNVLFTGLLYKLAISNIKGNTLRWLNNFFFTGWRIRTCIDGHTSEEREFHKEVAQGSVLSPLLLNVVMADFPTSRKGCELALSPQQTQGRYCGSP